MLWVSCPLKAQTPVLVPVRIGLFSKTDCPVFLMLVADSREEAAGEVARMRAQLISEMLALKVRHLLL